MKTDKIIIVTLAALVIIGPIKTRLTSAVTHINNQQQMAIQKDEAAAVAYWNTNVEPLRQQCLKQGGIPKLEDIPNTGKWDWQVICSYPPIPVTSNAGLVITETELLWIHNDKSAEADRVRAFLAALGWRCCTTK